MAVITTAIRKIAEATFNKRIKVIQGGTWAGKTYGILPVIIDYYRKRSGLRGEIVAETVPAVKSGAVKDFEEIMNTTLRDGVVLWDDKRYNRSDRVYTFESGSKLKFGAYDTVGKAKASGKRDDLFLNECNNIKKEIADALIIRTSGNVWMDFNPVSEFWVHTDYVGKDDVEFLILTYKDNEALPKSILKMLEDRIEKAKTSKYWENWVNVYVHGQIGSLQGTCIEGWNTIDKIPDGARLLGYGLDFGYSDDPSACVALYRYDGGYIFDEILYKKSLSNRNIYHELKDHERSLIVADSAEPKSIDEIKSYGLTIKGATKGKDSIAFGIKMLNDNDISVTSSSLNLIKELRSYTWKKARDGSTLNIPIDDFNHAIDAMRYIFTEINKPKKRSFFGAVTS